ncbi:hypothetical protein XENOCAPTIV_020742 [Xenoophorus captivus]|uniref:Uncharacterized protein n=1 Tax=Xenoophorus captivus TaxID=1517983 RepID=A0ABV0RDC2_9TELE
MFIIYRQAGSGYKVRLKEMADWGDSLLNIMISLVQFVFSLANLSLFSLFLFINAPSWPPALLAEVLMSSYLTELSEEIEDYTQRFNTEDQLEWNLVLQEVAAFIEVIRDPALSVELRLSDASDRFILRALCVWNRPIRWWF